MSYELIITEKPAAAKKVAESLADGKPIKKNINKVPYYEITHKDKDIVVCSAVGHLYGLAEEKKGKWTYPVFDIKWVPTADMNKQSEFSKKYLNVIKKLAKDANEFTVASDYDIEGEVIGLNVIRYACKQKDANRMKFSTLTKPDLIEAYENKSKTIDWGQAIAGETRHKLDWFYGINLSRALTDALKTGGRFKIMSIGRVQGPALKLVVDKEKEILAFKPEAYWMIELDGEKDKNKIEAWHEKDKIWDKKEAEKITKKIKDEKTAEVKNVDKKQFKQQPPTPFDLTSLQIEAHRTIRIAPKRTLELAQELYTAGAISYPRTSSQKLPAKLGFSKILNELKKQKEFSKECDFLLSKKQLKPNEGKKDDPAHPAIYPTGIIFKTEDDKTKKLYELIVRRFLATFGDDAIRETMKIELDCKKEIFITKGTTTVTKGWHELYGPFVNLKEEELPAFNKGDVLKVKKIKLHDKETSPPKRFTDASIIKELEKKNLGTKATRANIVETLFNRKYIEGKAIKATELGIQTADTLEKISPKILDQEMTRNFEDSLEEIRENKKTEDQILDKAKDVIIKIVDDFKKQKKNIGSDLIDANAAAEKAANMIGKCPNCEEGTLELRRGKFGRFIACDKYPDCKTTYNIPKTGLLKSAGKICEQCKTPMIQMIRKGKKPQELCLSPTCPSKEQEEKIEIEEKACPKCGKPLILRKSVYGAFLGCSNYPKCKHTEKIVSK